MQHAAEAYSAVEAAIEIASFLLRLHLVFFFCRCGLTALPVFVAVLHVASLTLLLLLCVH